MSPIQATIDDLSSDSTNIYPGDLFCGSVSGASPENFRDLIFAEGGPYLRNAITVDPRLLPDKINACCAHIDNLFEEISIAFNEGRKDSFNKEKWEDAKAKMHELLVVSKVNSFVDEHLYDLLKHGFDNIAYMLDTNFIVENKHGIVDFIPSLLFAAREITFCLREPSGRYEMNLYDHFSYLIALGEPMYRGYLITNYRQNMKIRLPEDLDSRRFMILFNEMRINAIKYGGKHIFVDIIASNLNTKEGAVRKIAILLSNDGMEFSEEAKPTYGNAGKTGTDRLQKLFGIGVKRKSAPIGVYDRLPQGTITSIKYAIKIMIPPVEA